MKKIGMNPVSVRYGGYLGYRYRFGMVDFGHIGIGISVSYRFLKGNICKESPGIGIIQIYRYRFGMADLGDIGICLNILKTDTDISVSLSVYWYRSNSN